MRATIGMITLLAGLTALTVKPPVKPAGENPSCLECHATVMQDSVKHAAALEECTSCHLSDGKPHPDSAGGGFTLNGEVPALCYNCHDPLGSGNSVHPPVANGKCGSCHATHSSPYASLLKYPRETICLECHDADVSGKKSAHEAFTGGKCESCHDPHRADGKKLLRSENPELCLKCHQEEKSMMKSASVHPPFERNCMICHQGHGSEEPWLLKEKSNDLCSGCHDDIVLEIQESPNPHRAALQPDGCIACHSGHASAGSKLMPPDESEVCIRCHRGTRTSGGQPTLNMRDLLAKSSHIHGAIVNGGCKACHLPHASKNGHLLTAPYPAGNYSGNVADSSALCFTCHDIRMLQADHEPGATGFRNGTKNLHILHTSGSGGRTCRSCHDPHGAMNEHLVAGTVSFGKWQMPIRFVAGENGGSCTPGCHAEKSYKR